ncbi:MAG: FecR family protein [Tannerella sp.]|jgi:ferric-dicitrate binding protein FerR (iron transport regulator)|nr:FecR family protein [Tannerella sp.]
MTNLLLKLLSQLMFGKISPDEFKQLRSEIKERTDSDLQSAMQTVWDDDRTPSPLPASTKFSVLDALNQYARSASSRLRWLKIASIILLPLLLTWGPYWYVSNQNDSRLQQEMVIMTDTGQKTHICLPDGSKVWLNAQSSLSYPSGFGAKNRIVRLAGEGYFEIAKDKEMTFCVETEGVNVVVHGTKFNISAHPTHSTTDISLIEGSVSVENKAQDVLAVLTPQHTIKVNRQNLQFEVMNEDTRLTAIWSQNKCRIEDASAEEVFKKMAYWYGMNIHLQNNKTKHHYTFTIKEESFREFLELINELTPMEYSINGEEVTIRYK